jgi:hypothetical protein
VDTDLSKNNLPVLDGPGRRAANTSLKSMRNGVNDSVTLLSEKGNRFCYRNVVFYFVI